MVSWKMGVSLCVAWCKAGQVPQVRPTHHLSDRHPPPLISQPLLGPSPPLKHRLVPSCPPSLQPTQQARPTPPPHTKPSPLAAPTSTSQQAYPTPIPHTNPPLLPPPPAHPMRPGSTGTRRPPGTVGPRWPPTSGWSACSSGGARCGWARPQNPAGRSSRGHCAVVVTPGCVGGEGRVVVVHACVGGASLVGVLGVSGGD